MINYINFSKIMKRNINIQDLQKKQLIRRKIVVMKNEYFYISAIPYNLAEYRDYF